MKTFNTSNYAKNGTNPNAVAISFSSDIPSDYTGKIEANLAPTDQLLTAYHDREIGHDRYAEEYITLLTSRGLTPESVAAQFEDGTVFVCYDYEDGSATNEQADSGDLSICHRVFLSKWLNDAGVATVTEI